MKQYAKCIVLIMSGGSGMRFGADKPKQYCLMNGKPIIEYVLDVCCHSSSVDEAVIVAAKDYLDIIHEKYGYPVTCGGENRTESLYNGLQYVNENYYCEKIIIVNAVCPLMTEEQIDRYFSLLDEYDYVLTAWKVVSTLGKYDGTLVDRNDYFQCMEPEAYRFPLLFNNYKKDYPVPYIFHQLPKDSKGYKCFDYPYTMKITYQHDVRIAELLYNELINAPKVQATQHKINLWLSSFENDSDITNWLLDVPNYLKNLMSKWDITSISMNPLTTSTCVYEGHSSRYGDVIIKMHSPLGRYYIEREYYKQSANNKYVADLIDYDDDYRALLIEKVSPGIQVKFNLCDEKLKDLYSYFYNNPININNIDEKIDYPTIISEYMQSKQLSDNHNFRAEFRAEVQDIAEKLWQKYFENADKFFLHRDLHRRNILKSKDFLKAIDPLGVIGPKEFEFTIALLIEMKCHSDYDIEDFNKMIDYFSAFCDKDRLMAASFITWVHKMNEYTFVKHDDYCLSNWAAEMIEKLFRSGKIFSL